jgi:DNA modification methylase
VSTATYLVGDVFDRLAEIPDGTVDLVLTSPPFLALRSYLPADHPDKAREIGSEATPADFLDTLLALTAEWRRVLAPHGSICVELGDTYAGSGGGGGDYLPGGLREGQPGFTGSASAARDRDAQRAANAAHWRAKNAYRNGTDGRVHGERRGHGAPGGSAWPLDKSLTGIPTLYAWSLAYGRNLLTGEESPAGQWRIRNVIAWVRPNPPVGALGDKFRPGTSYMTVATIARDRYFDLDAVRTVNPDGQGIGKPAGRRTGESATYPGNGGNHRMDVATSNPAGAPPLDWWEIPTQPYKGSHYATFPPALCVRPILAMSPQRVCTTCGEPSRRIVDIARISEADDSQRTKHANGERPAPGRQDRAPEVGWQMTHTTVGWSDCGHDTWRPGHVLDPFAGSGTTLAVATGHGRNATGIDLDARNADLARERIGMFLTVATCPEATAS